MGQWGTPKTEMGCTFVPYFETDGYEEVHAGSKIDRIASVHYDRHCDSSRVMEDLKNKYIGMTFTEYQKSYTITPKPKKESSVCLNTHVEFKGVIESSLNSVEGSAGSKERFITAPINEIILISAEKDPDWCSPACVVVNNIEIIVTPKTFKELKKVIENSKCILNKGNEKVRLIRI